MAHACLVRRHEPWSAQDPTMILTQMMWHVDEVGEQFLTPATTRAMCKAGQHIYGAQPQLCAHVLALFR